ncbi:MAG: sigma-54-dependent Fis family transcriptional regulator [Planctomycetes bacterium]|nr:sigma-54-dependent Fis family transcriptional regulator [Planctomycetota bacterium]
MRIEKILIVDDDNLSRSYVSEALLRSGYVVESADGGHKAIEMVANSSYDMIFLDLKMPGISGFDVLKKIKKHTNETIVVMMTAYGSIESAVEAMRMGAYDYVIKPISLDQIDLLLKRVEERQNLIAENKYWRSRVDGNEDLCEPVMNEKSKMYEIYQNIKKIARSKAGVLIQGESGTGKELIAQAIYLQSDRSKGPFIKVNCAALSESLLESELFGHERGAFTGADSKRLGRFELANNGTLLLDEVSEISPKIQSKLLRVLEEEEFERVGGSKTLKVDARIIATTNRDILKEIEKERFRQDLYFRLNVIPIIIPPLRERRVDIPDLVNYFLGKYACGSNTPVKEISDKAKHLLCQYDWPGNVRELRNLIHRSVVMVDSEVLLPEHFENMLNVNSVQKEENLTSGKTIEDVERVLIYKTLEETHGNKTRAAEILDITPRTLRNKLSKYESDRSHVVIDEGVRNSGPAVEESFSL